MCSNFCVCYKHAILNHKNFANTFCPKVLALFILVHAAFLAIIQQMRDLEMPPHCGQQPIKHTISEALNYRYLHISYTRHAAVVSMVCALEGLHCNYLLQCFEVHKHSSICQCNHFLISNPSPLALIII